jgi:hypothetical protein
MHSQLQAWITGTGENTRSISGGAQGTWYKYRWGNTVNFRWKYLVQIQAEVYGQLQVVVPGTSTGGSTRSITGVSTLLQAQVEVSSQ